jgi:hypothetical protein
MRAQYRYRSTDIQFNFRIVAELAFGLKEIVQGRFRAIDQDHPAPELYFATHRRGPSGALTTSERAELVQLRRENQRLRMERKS